MSTATFAQKTLREVIAPPGSGVNIQDRIRVAARRLGWSFSRTKDVWYADPRVSIDGEELVRIEETSGVKYGRAELRSVEELIARADSLLDSGDADFYRPFVSALRAFFRSVDRPGTEGDR